MTIRLLTIIIALLLPFHMPDTAALTMEQFSNICKSSPGKCSDHPTLQAYVGGALDLLATLDERTDYLHKVYCKAPEELFDVSAIIRFMEQQSEHHRSDNAMLVLIRYIEKHGGCNHE